MACKHESARYWREDEDAWACYVCGDRTYRPLGIAEGYADCNMQFSVNCGSIVTERTHGRMKVRSWIDASRTTNLWHAYQEKVGKEKVYFTHTDSFDSGYQQYAELKQEHYVANGWQQNLIRDIRIADVTSGSAIRTDPSSGSCCKVEKGRNS